LWCDTLLTSNKDEDVAEGLRLLALAAVNVSKADEALHLLYRAEEMTRSCGQRAHLCYLQGLIQTKRCYDLSGSTAHYERGLAALRAGGSETGDLSLERGWLLNGLALNEAILWRRNPGAAEHYARAFALEQDAFNLVREGDHPARIYLRFNL